MAAQAGQVTASIQSIAAVAEESSAMTEEVSASSEEMLAQSEEMSAQAQELARTAEELQHLVSRFQLDEHDDDAPNGVDRRRGEAPIARRPSADRADVARARMLRVS